MSLYADNIFGIPAPVNGVGSPVNGGNHPGDFAPAQKIIDFCEKTTEDYAKSPLGPYINGTMPPSMRRLTEPVDVR